MGTDYISFLFQIMAFYLVHALVLKDNIEEEMLVLELLF